MKALSTMEYAGTYKEFSPCKSLTLFVECFWSSRHPPGTDFTFRILPDACADIIFDFTGNDDPLYIVGMATTFMDKDIRGRSEYFGIRFKAGGLYPFVHQPTELFTNEKIGLHEVSSMLYKMLSETVRPDMSDEGRIRNSEKILLKLLSHSAFTSYDYIYGSVDFIIKSKGLTNLRSIADHACISERQLQRKFIERVGVSPKTLSNIVRFMYTKNLAGINPDFSMTDLADEGGYFDHSHLYRDFRRFAGRVPG